MTTQGAPAVTECVVYRLRPGCAEAYDAHHARVWPEVIEALACCGIREYTIHRRDDLVVGMIRRGPVPAPFDLPAHVRRKVEEWDALMSAMLLPWDGAGGPAQVLASSVFDIGDAQYAAARAPGSA